MNPLTWGLILFAADLLVGFRYAAQMRGGMFTLWILSLAAIFIAAPALATT